MIWNATYTAVIVLRSSPCRRIGSLDSNWFLWKLNPVIYSSFLNRNNIAKIEFSMPTARVKTLRDQMYFKLSHWQGFQRLSRRLRPHAKRWSKPIELSAWHLQAQASSLLQSKMTWQLKGFACWEMCLASSRSIAFNLESTWITPVAKVICGRQQQRPAAAPATPLPSGSNTLQRRHAAAGPALKLQSTHNHGHLAAAPCTCTLQAHTHTSTSS